MAFDGPQSGDIRATLALSPAEAQNGSSRTLSLPGGRRITVPVRAGIRDGEQIRLKGQGESAWPGGPVGDLVLTVSIPNVGPHPSYANNPGSPTDYMQAPSPSSTLPATSCPSPAAPNYPAVGPHGSSSSSYPPSGAGVGYTNYPEPAQAQGPIHLYRNQAPDAYPPSYTGYPQAGQQFPQQPPPKQRRFSLTVTILLIVVVLLILAASSLIYYIDVYRPQQIHAGATATVNAQVTVTAQANTRATANALGTSMAQANATGTAQATATAGASATATALQAILTQATSGTPTLNDPLSSPSNNNWDQLAASNSTANGSCAYTAGAYHSSMPQKGFFQPCFAQGPSFSNFAFQVQMTITQGDEGGIIFRADPVHSKFYLFRISQSGSYDLFVYLDNQGGHTKHLLSNSSSIIKIGQNQTNTITVVAQGSNIYFFINSQYLDRVSNNTFASGKIGVFGESNTNPTDVAFSNAEVWQL
jgi:hypothetical protein